MLSFFRKKNTTKKIVFGGILSVLALSMVIYLVPGLIGVDPTNPVGNTVVARVGGERIMSWDLQQQVQQMARTNRVPPEMAWLYTQQVLDNLVLDKLTTQEARRLGLRVTDEDVRTRLRAIPELYPDGRFVGQQMYENLVIERFGITVEEFERRFRDSLLLEKLRFVVTDPVTVSEEEVREDYLRNNEKLVLKYVYLEPEKFKSGVTVDDTVLQEYFERNRSRYMVPEKRTVQLIVLDNERAKQGITVPEADLRTYYQQNMDQYRLPERVHAQHILLKSAEGGSPDAAREKAEDLLRQLRGGADFEELARAHSEDAGSAPQGGDLGWIVRGQTVPQFEAAAFSLEAGQLSEPVQTEYGIHLLNVIAREQARVQPLEEVQNEIEQTLLAERVQSMLATSAEQVAAEWRRDPQNAQAAASRFNGTVMNPPPLARDEPIAGLSGTGTLMEDIFILEPEQIGRPVALPSGYVIPRLLEVAGARQSEFAEVRERVREEYVTEQASDKVQALGLELAQAVERQERRDLAQAARSLGLTATTTEPLLRNATIPLVGSVAALGPGLDNLQPGQTAGPVRVAGGEIVYQIESREAPEESGLEGQRSGIRDRLLAEKRGLAFLLFQENLKERLTESGDVRIYDEAVARLTAGPAMPLQ